MVREKVRTLFHGSGSSAKSLRKSRRPFLFRADARQDPAARQRGIASRLSRQSGKGFDEKCVKFLRVDYDGLVERVKQGGTDKEILDWCFTVGRKPTADDIYVWNEFMRKRGWNDEVSEMVERRKAEAGMTDRSDIQTSFQFIDADEGRLPKCG